MSDQAQHAPLTSQALKDAVFDELARQAEAEPGKLKAINFAQFSAVWDQVDSQIQKFYPVVGPLLPAQVQAIAGIVATVVHAVNGGLNPAPGA